VFLPASNAPDEEVDKDTSTKRAALVGKGMEVSTAAWTLSNPTIVKEDLLADLIHRRLPHGRGTTVSGFQIAVA
jgi:hypothetical protein